MQSHIIFSTFRTAVPVRGSLRIAGQRLTGRNPHRTLHTKLQSQASIRSGFAKKIGAAALLAGSLIFVASHNLIYNDDGSTKRAGNKESNTVIGKHPDASANVPHPGQTGGERMITAKELSEHTTREKGLWVAIDGAVWDVTDFVDLHPGGSKIIISNCGKDSTKLFKSLHPPNAIQENLAPSKQVGIIDPSDVKSLEEPETEDEKRISQAREAMMGVSGMINLDDFEELAHKILSPTALAYYASGSDDELTMHENRDAYRRIKFRPRVMRKVRDVDPSTEILGVKSSLPIFIAPAALAKLGHPLGEINLTRGAGETGMLQVISSNASCSLEELSAERVPGQELGWQYYVAADRKRAEKTLQKAVGLGMHSIWVTVDAPVGGNRERDEKEKIARDPPAKDSGLTRAEGSTSAAQFAYVDPNLCWEDIAWIKKLAPGKPIIIKGVQCVEDAELALEYGCQGIVLSNHGGRQLEGSRAPIDVLQEIHRVRPELVGKIDIFVDGGIRRGTDVLKALCLGAKAVGLGRPFLYAQSAYGSDGVVRVHEILEREIEIGMRLLGVTKISELTPELLDLGFDRVRDSERGRRHEV